MAKLPQATNQTFLHKGEAIDTDQHNLRCIALVVGWKFDRIRPFLDSLLLVMSTIAALMIAVFFIQHNFPGSYTNEEDWSYFKGSEGSSFQ